MNPQELIAQAIELLNQAAALMGGGEQAPEAPPAPSPTFTDEEVVAGLDQPQG